MHVKSQGSVFVEREPEIELAEKDLSLGRAARGPIAREQVLPKMGRSLLPILPGEKLAQFPFVKFAEKIGVVVAIDFGEPGFENFCVVAFPVNGLHLPFGKDHIGAEPGENERPEQNTIAPIKGRSPKPGESGKRLL